MQRKYTYKHFSLKKILNCSAMLQVLQVFSQTTENTINQTNGKCRSGSIQKTNGSHKV